MAKASMPKGPGPLMPSFPAKASATRTADTGSKATGAPSLKATAKIKAGRGF